MNDGWAPFRTLVTTIAELDPAAAGAASSVRYVGPVMEQFPAHRWQSPWEAADARPLVLVSFSTTGFWDQGARIRNTLAALGEGPVRILVSGPDAADLGPLPANVAVRSFVPHGLCFPAPP